MKGLAIGSVLAILVSSGAGAQQLSPEATKAAEAYLTCIRSFATKLDDGKSDASTIALAVAGACSVERRNYAVVTSRGNFEVQVATQEALDRKALGMATRWVLVGRAAKAAPPARAPKSKKGEPI